MKRFLSIFLALCMLISTFVFVPMSASALSVYPDDQFGYYINTQEINGTQYIVATTVLQRNTGFASLEMTLRFNTAKLTVVTADAPTDYPNPIGKFQTGTDRLTGEPVYTSGMSVFNIDEAGIDLSKVSFVKLVAVTGLSESTTDGDIFHAYFTLKEGYKYEDIVGDDFTLEIETFADINGKDIEYTCLDTPDATQTPEPTAEPSGNTGAQNPTAPTPPLPTPVEKLPEETMKEGDYTYAVVDGNAIILGFEESAKGDVEIPSTLGGYPVTEIYEIAFSYCSDITSVTIPSSVRVVGEYAFANCTSMKTISIPSTVMYIGELVFDDCLSLSDITVDDSNPVYSSKDGVLFNKDKTRLIVYPAGKPDEKYTIPDGVEIVEEKAFLRSKIVSVTYPESVTSIKFGTFYGCNKLSEVNISDSVTTIEDWAFYWCEALTNINIPKNVAVMDKDVFPGCSALTDINVNKDNQAFSSVDGVLFNKDRTELIKYPCGKTNEQYVIADGVTYIAIEAFSSNKNLKSVTIPESVIHIGKKAFAYTALTNVTVPDSVNKIESGVFMSCESLVNAELSDNITVIEESLFAHCKNLKSVTIPESVITISSYAFDDCDSLTEVYYAGTEEQWNGINIWSGDGSLTSATIFYENDGSVRYTFPFTDVADNAWYRGDVEGAHKKGLINGKSETEYMPNDNMTYAEAVKLACCMNQLYYDGKVTLTSGINGMWYSSYMDYAVNKEIIEYDLSDVADMKITRHDFVKIFYKAIPLRYYGKINEVVDDKIPDVKMEDDGAEEIYAFYRAGILTGSDDAGTFYGSSNITRAEVAAILTRMYDSRTRKTITLN